MSGKRIHIEEKDILLEDGENVLDALERHGIPMLYSCRSGVCQSCLVKASEGKIPSKAQQGLKESLKAQGYFLSCVCVPEENMKLALPGEGLNHTAKVVETDDVGAGVRRLRLSIPDEFKWFAGQYITVIREDGFARSYSVASGPQDGHIELHVRRIPGGALSNWLHDDVKPGDPITFRGPFGECFYTPGEPDAPLLLAGTGTGLAPLYGILNDALRNGHSGPIRLYHGALEQAGLYYIDELKSLAKTTQLEYSACLLRGNGSDDPSVIHGALDEVVLSQSPSDKKTKSYLCGDPALVETMRKKLFMKGMSNRRIFADPFVATAQKKE